MESSSYWRDYFAMAKSDIFDVVENAIRLAILDYPDLLLERRDKIAEMMFSSVRSTESISHSRARVPVAVEDNNRKDVCEVRESKPSESGSTIRSATGGLSVTGSEKVTQRAGADIETITDQVNKGTMILNEMLRIKGILKNHKNESDSSLLDSLRSLRLMDLSIEFLMATSIEEYVRPLCTMRSEEIGSLAQALLDEWRAMKDEWFKYGEVKADYPSSVKQNSFPDEEWPPFEDYYLLDEPVDLSENFFEDLDENGNPRNAGRQLRIQQVPTETDLHPESKRPKLKRKSHIETSNKHAQSGTVAASVRPKNPLTPVGCPEQVPKRQQVDIKPKTTSSAVDSRPDGCRNLNVGQGLNNASETDLPGGRDLSKEKFKAAQKRTRECYDRAREESKRQETGSVRPKLKNKSHIETSNSNKHAQSRIVAARLRPKNPLIPAGYPEHVPKRQQVDIKPKTTTSAVDSRPDGCRNLYVGQGNNASKTDIPGGHDLSKEKFKAAQKRIREFYDQAREEKKKRTVRVLNLADIPKDSVNHRDLRVRPGFRGSSSSSWRRI